MHFGHLDLFPQQLSDLSISPHQSLIFFSQRDNRLAYCRWVTQTDISQSKLGSSRGRCNEQLQTYNIICATVYVVQNRLEHEAQVGLFPALLWVELTQLLSCKVVG